MPSRPSLPLAVYRNTVLDEDLEIIDMSESAGVERLDCATLHYPTHTLEGRAFHSQITNDEIEIIRTDTEESLHWGKVGIVPPVLNTSGEALIIKSRTEKYHLGNRLQGYWVWNPMRVDDDLEPDPGPVLVLRDLVFNPIIDGRTYGNLNDTYGSEGSSLAGHPLIIDPESVRTAAGRTLQGANSKAWPLSSAVWYLMTTLNPAETYVTNPLLATIASAVDDDNDLVLNVQIPIGTYLADALDLLLNPMGYRWRVKRTALGARTFEVYGRNAGSLVAVRHQALGTSLNTDAQNVEAAGLTFDITNLFNEVSVIGGPLSYEVTVELARAWPAAQDELDDALLAKTAEGFESVKNAYRKWVLNEAGDYIGLRTELDGVFTSEFRSNMETAYSAIIWNDLTPMRRKLLPTLTLSDDNTPIGTVQGIEVEYHNSEYDSEHPERGAEWLPIGNWGARVLEHECGIYFDGEFPPLEELTGATSRAGIRIRVTATIATDEAVKDTAERQSDSPNENVVPFVMDARSKFRYQIIAPFSKYDSTDRPSLAANDQTALVDFAANVRAIWDLMDVGGALQLEGLDANDTGTPYDLGQRVTGILGKNIDFEAKADSDEYPQIVGIDRNVQQQTMTLHLQRIKRNISFNGTPLRRNKLAGRRGRP